jgi:hypothetical protein
VLPTDPKLIPVFWGLIAASGISGVVLAGSLTLLLGSQRPIVLRTIWIASSILIASATALVMILTN